MRLYRIASAISVSSIARSRIRSFTQGLNLLALMDLRKRKDPIRAADTDFFTFLAQQMWETCSLQKVSYFTILVEPYASLPAPGSCEANKHRRRTSQRPTVRQRLI